MWKATSVDGGATGFHAIMIRTLTECTRLGRSGVSGVGARNGCIPPAGFIDSQNNVALALALPQATGMREGIQAQMSQITHMKDRVKII